MKENQLKGVKAKGKSATITLPEKRGRKPGLPTVLASLVKPYPEVIWTDWEGNSRNMRIQIQAAAKRAGQEVHTAGGPEGFWMWRKK